MPLDLTPLDSGSRLLVEATLRVAPGSGGRFQPTGFPDLGPALYKGIRSASEPASIAESVDMLLVESVQSMANRLENVCVEGEDYNADCQGIPYVRVLDGHGRDAFLTSSVREPHRLASPYVLAAKQKDVVYRESVKKWLVANKQRPVHLWKIAPAIFQHDPGCVLHGVFLEEIDGRVRLPRLVSAYIEACSPSQANSGGVYRGEVTAKDNIPYSRQEFTASTITASFIFHLSTLESYRLSAEQNRFLQTWAMYKIDRFLNRDLRLRTACEFEFEQDAVRVTIDGKQQDLGNGTGRWPVSSDVKAAFIGAKGKCFPPVCEGTEWEQRRVTVVTYAVDIVGQEELLSGLAAEQFKLGDFPGRAEIKRVTEGKGGKKRDFSALVITGEWPEEDQASLLASNPEQNQGENGDETDNPAHPVIKKALKKWIDNWKKVQKKSGGIEEIGDDV